MKTAILIFLIALSIIALAIPALFIFFKAKKMEPAVWSLVKGLLYHKRFEFLFGMLAYLAILAGSFGLLNSNSWSKPMVLIGLTALLLFVWVQNIWKIHYFHKLKSGNSANLRNDIESKMKSIFEPLEQDVMGEVAFDDGFYQLAVRKNVKKAIRRIVVGTLLLAPPIWYLLS